MSYFIKTPHTIFEVVGENDRVYFVKAKGNPNDTYSKSKCQTQVLAAANTIEELCDRFVIEYKQHNEQRILKTFIKAERNFLKDKMHQLNHIKNLYGAIWTDKGLIYVAKMNEKGELELL